MLGTQVCDTCDRCVTHPKGLSVTLFFRVFIDGIDSVTRVTPKTNLYAHAHAHKGKSLNHLSHVSHEGVWS